MILACLDSLERIQALPVDPRVQALFYDAFAMLAEPPKHLQAAFQIGEYPFLALSKVATLTRFPAGQLDWELSGINGWHLRAAPARDLPAMVALIARMGGVRPLFMPHFSVFKSNLLVMLPAEVNRSFHRMAKTMELQPEIRGFVGQAWFFAPETYRISPHLAWLRATILDNGGFATTVGETSAPEVATRLSIRRRQEFEVGSFRPKEGLVVWPREAMIRWANEHPEFNG